MLDRIPNDVVERSDADSFARPNGLAFSADESQLSIADVTRSGVMTAGPRSGMLTACQPAT